MEFEISQFSAVGWQFRQDSQKIPEEYWLGGHTSIHYQCSNEPNDHFLQVAANLGYENGQSFLLGRRIHHSSFVDSSHDDGVRHQAAAALDTDIGVRTTVLQNGR